MKKRLILVLLALAIGVSVMACGKTTTETPTTTAATTVTTQPTTVTTEAPLPTSLDILPDLNPTPENIIGVYDLALTDGVATINYDKYGWAWASMQVNISEDVTRFNKLVLTAQGEGDLMIRFIGSEEVWEARVTLTSNDVMYQIDLRDFDTFLGTLETINFVAAPGDGAARGAIVISQLTFDTGTAYGTTVDLEEPGYNAAYGWTSNEEGVYTVTTELDNSVTIAYDKGAEQGWSWVGRTYDLEDTMGYNMMTVVIQGTDGTQFLVKPNDNGGMEKWITLDGTVQTVEVPLTADLSRIVCFAEPGVGSVSGSVSIKSMILSYVPEEADVSAYDTFDFTNGWVAADEGVYGITYADDVTTVSWTERSNAWSYIKNEFAVDLSKHNTVTMVVQGTTGQQLIIKPNDNGAYEQTITFDGTEQTFTFTLTETPTKVLIFVDPINGSAAGSFEIISATTSYVPSGTNFNVGWTENDADTYAITTAANGVVTVNYTKTADQGWVYMSTTFDAEEAAGMNTMLVVLRGTVGKQILLKPNDSGALETWVTFENEDPVYVYISADSFTNCMIFAEGGSSAAVSGTFEILKVEMSYAEPNAIERDVVYDFEDGWIDNDGGVYTIVYADGKTTVTWADRTANWALIKNVFTENLSDHNTITMVVKGTVGQQIIIKPNDNGAYEQTITFDGTEQTVTIIVSDPEKVLVFVDPILASTSGSFEIITATVSYVPQPLEITNGWAENDAGTYTISQDNVDGSVVVNYATTDTYQFMINNFDSDLAYGLNTMTIVIQGTDGNQLLLKPNDSGSMEQIITFDGTEQTFTFTAEAFSKLLMFAAPGVTGGQTGSFTIVSLTLTYVDGE